MRSKTLLALASVLMIWLPSAAQAQTQTYCGPEVKEEVVRRRSLVSRARRRGGT